MTRASVKYLDFAGNTYASLTYQGRTYALAPAMSADATRFVGLIGLSASGLEWTEWHGEGTLSSFKGSDVNNGQAVASKCKPVRY